VPIDRHQLATRLRSLAAQGVYLGTSSWKYPGWFGSIYERDRYVWRGRFSEARFERNCLAEFAQTFSAVSVDASYYQFFKPKTLDELAAQVPDTFRFAFKVCGDITLKRFPQLPRFGHRAGTTNPHFLDADLFVNAILAPYTNIRRKLGLLMFEFSRFGPGEFARGSDFVAALDAFLEKLPPDWPYAVELRNRHWLRPEYFAMLARHGVTHIYNAWADMPPVSEQMRLTDSETNPARLAARFLLHEGRTYEQAVKLFSPYNEIKETNPAGRAAAVALARRARQSRGQGQALIFVNNRFEGHSPGTISAIVSELADDQE
jgi:uncharacterized protein YecE (DUF72 family)